VARVQKKTYGGGGTWKKNHSEEWRNHKAKKSAQLTGKKEAVEPERGVSQQG